jgi:hypothetical protein
MRGSSRLGNEVEVGIAQDGDENEGRMNGVDIVSTPTPVSEDGEDREDSEEEEDSSDESEIVDFLAEDLSAGEREGEDAG